VVLALFVQYSMWLREKLYSWLWQDRRKAERKFEIERDLVLIETQKVSYLRYLNIACLLELYYSNVVKRLLTMRTQSTRDNSYSNRSDE
jgi:hypothetical protein